MLQSAVLILFLLNLPAAYALDGSVMTESGLVAGSGDKVAVFKGIPYAAPPTGDPNGAGLPTWPAYTASADRYMEFGNTTEIRAGFHTKELDFLRDFFARLRARRTEAR